MPHVISHLSSLISLKISLPLRDLRALGGEKLFPFHAGNPFNPLPQMLFWNPQRYLGAQSQIKNPKSINCSSLFFFRETIKVILTSIRTINPFILQIRSPIRNQHSFLFVFFNETINMRPILDLPSHQSPIPMPKSTFVSIRFFSRNEYRLLQNPQPAIILSPNHLITWLTIS